MEIFIIYLLAATIIVNGYVKFFCSPKTELYYNIISVLVAVSAVWVACWFN